MSDIIQILPDAVANQIAAGEVIQRPASIVKELVENAIDAKATSIDIILKDAGKTLVQVIDNGKGMSETDARMAFERHATSKIRKAEDLFEIRSMGFRGEALASIAAVAQVELKTKQKDNELGTIIQINGSNVVSQEATQCKTGSNFCIKNLFFNIPARRKFLKANSTELKHIVQEFQRIVLAHPEISFSLHHNGNEMYHLPSSKIRQRVINVFGKQLNQSLISIGAETSIVNIKGFVGKPEFAKKTQGEQFFFVNNRFMKDGYFHKAVMLAYDQLLPQQTYPSYFIFFEIPPQCIDINIHPTKTEIKFEEATAVFKILTAAVKEALGKFNIVPSLDFDTEGLIDIPVLNKDTEMKAPEVKVNPNFNPFEQEKKSPYQTPPKSKFDKNYLDNWENLYQNFEEETPPQTQQENLFITEEHSEAELQTGEENFLPESGKKFLQLKNKYILSPVKSGLMLIDQKRAHERILYEQYLNTLINSRNVAQQSLFPAPFTLSPEDCEMLNSILEDLRKIGFDIREFGKNTFVINGTPAIISNQNTAPEELIKSLLEDYQNQELSLAESMKKNISEKLARSLAKVSSLPYGKILTSEEMNQIIDRLFACESPNYTPSGKIIISMIKSGEIEKRF